jgi:hypothetical protein
MSKNLTKELDKLKKEHRSWNEAVSRIIWSATGSSKTAFIGKLDVGLQKEKSLAWHIGLNMEQVAIPDNSIVIILFLMAPSRLVDVDCFKLFLSLILLWFPQR